MSRFVDILQERFGAGEPILTEDVLAAFPESSRATVFNRLKASMLSGEVRQYMRGVYYIPEKTWVLGREIDVPLDPEKVIRRKYLEDDGETVGFVSGLALENRAGVSNQVPGVLEITTNNETNRMRRIVPFGGYREIILRRPRIPVTSENVATLEAIDLIGNVDVSSLDGEERSAFKEKVSAADAKRLLEALSAYPKKTITQYLKGVSLGLIPA